MVSTLVIKVVSPMISDDEQVLSSNSSPNVGNNNNIVYRTTSCTTAPELLEETERLRKENMQLNHEMSQFKSLCNNILTLMTNDDSGFSHQQLELGRLWSFFLRSLFLRLMTLCMLVALPTSCHVQRRID